MPLVTRTSSRVIPLGAVLSLAIAAGCNGSSQKPENDRDAEKNRQIESLKAQLDEQTRGRKQAEAFLEDEQRESGRLSRELVASQGKATAFEKEFKLAEQFLAQAREEREELKRWKIEALASRVKLGGAGEGAAEVGSAEQPLPRGNSPARLKELDLDAPVALVDGEAVSRREFAEWLFYNFLYTDRFDQYLNNVLVAREAKRLGVAVTDAEVEHGAAEQLALLEKEYGGPDKVQKTLERAGFTLDNMLDVLRINARNTILATKLCFAWRDTPEGKKRIEARLRQAYLQSNVAPRANVKHLYIIMPPGSTEDDWTDAAEHAKKLRARLEAGEEPKVIIADAQKGSLKGRVMFDPKPFTKFTAAQFPELDKAVFEGEIGQYQGPIRSGLGLSIVYVQDRSKATKTFEEVEADLRADLLKPDRLGRDEDTELYQDLRARAKIEKKVDFK